MSTPSPQDVGPADAAAAALARVCSLDEPVRRRLYEHLAARPGPVSRDQAAAALGLERATVAYHLDRLVEAGLLAASFARPGGAGGPGAGRPTKYYSRVEDEITISLPARDYRLAAEILARAVLADASGTVRRAVEAAAAAMGAELAAQQPEDDLIGFLGRHGFEPFRDGEVVRLRNCPFHVLARRHTELVCGINLAMLDAATDRIAPEVTVHLDPAPTRCCVAFLPSPTS